MKYDYTSYKIDKLLKMAGLTSSNKKREWFIDQANNLLQEMSAENIEISPYCLDDFYHDCIENDHVSIAKRADIYSAYLKYCEIKKAPSVSNTKLYRYLRGLGIRETKTSDSRHFKVKLNDPADKME